MWSRARLQLLHRYTHAGTATVVFRNRADYSPGNGWWEYMGGSKSTRARARKDVFTLLLCAIHNMAWRGESEFKVLDLQGRVLLYTDFSQGLVHYTRYLSWWQRAKFWVQWKQLRIKLEEESLSQRVGIRELCWRKA